jgi:hypothetical protein
MTAPNPARRFAQLVLRDWLQEPGDLPGDVVQDYLVQAGLLAPATATEPCGEGCACAEIADFPTLCYRLTRAGKAARDAR